MSRLSVLSLYFQSSSTSMPGWVSALPRTTQLPPIVGTWATAAAPWSHVARTTVRPMTTAPAINSTAHLATASQGSFPCQQLLWAALMANQECSLAMKVNNVAKILWSILIWCWCIEKVSDRCLLEVDPRVFTQQTHDVIIASSLCQKTSWRRFDEIMMLLLRHVPTGFYMGSRVRVRCYSYNMASFNSSKFHMIGTP